MERRRSNKTTSFFIIYIFIFLAIGILIAGYLFYNKQKEHLTSEAYYNLAAVADLKINQIIQWKKERAGDANFLSGDLLLAREIQSYLKAGHSKKPADNIISMLSSFKNNLAYEYLALFDTSHKLLFATGKKDSIPAVFYSPLLDSAVINKKTEISDLYLIEGLQSVCLDIAAPLYSPDDRNSVIAAVLLRVDPNLILFPIIQSWPTPSRTAETLLFEQEGDSILLLNELRYLSNTTLRLHIPISDINLPAVKAAHGERGIVEGIDYRGMKVIAEIKDIPGSPWFMVSKIDEDEVYEPLRQQTWLVGISIFFLIFATAATVGFWWRHQRANFYKEKYYSELMRKALIRHFDYIIKYANDIILLLNTDGKIIEANERALLTYGYTVEEISEMHIRDLRSPRTRGSLDAQMKQVEKEGGMVFETEHIRKDGTVFPVEVSSRIIEIDKSRFYQSIVRDITERKKTEEAFRASEAMLIESQKIASMGHYNLDIASGKWTSSEVLDEIFGIDKNYVKDIEGWLNIVHPDDREEMTAYLKDHVLKGGNTFNREYRIVRVNDGAVHWLHGLGRIEFDSDGKPVKMFGTIQDITERKQAEEVFLESEEITHTLLNAIKDAAYLLDTYSRIIGLNEAGAKRFGRSIDESTGQYIEELFPPELAASRKKLIQDVILHPKVCHFRDEFAGRYYENSIYPIYDVHGMVSNVAFYSRDVTEQKKAEESLQEINETLNTIIEAAPLAIYSLDLEGRVQKVWNSAAEKLLGWKKEEVIGKFLPSIPTNRKSEFHKLHDEIKSNRPINGIQVVRQKKDGSVIEYEIYASPLHDQSGKITGNIVLLVDLTERRQAEETQRQSEALFKMLVETSPVAIAVSSGPAKKLDYLSHRFTELFGYELEDLPTMNRWWQVAYPAEEYRNQIEIKWCEIMEKAREEDGEMESIDSVINCKDSSTKYVESTFTSIGDQTLMFFSDLTQRRMAEEALRQSHAFNDLLIQTLPFGIDIVDENGKILFMSRSMKNMIGTAGVNSCCWEKYRDNKQRCENCPLQKSIPFGKQETIEVGGMFDGRTYEISYIGMMYESQKAMLEVFKDVTERKKLQQELTQSQKLLSIGTMAGGIAHDFNNILAIILGYSSILQSIKDLPDKFSEGITAIKQAVDRGAGLVRQILTFARKTDASFEPLSIPELVKELVSMLQQTFPKIITFRVSMDKQLPYINADHTQMHQAILNLCVNARDAMPDGGEISIRAVVLNNAKVKEVFPSASNKYYICLTVSDTGIGIEESVRNRIFDPFFTTKEKGKGTGLGLSVVYGIVQAHQGLINVESDMGHGTSFNLYLPIPEESSRALESVGKTEEHIVGGNETILFVEDEPLLLDMIQILLESNGYKVLTARDGEEAVDIYSRNSKDISLVVSDMGLPKLTGIAEFEKMKEVNSNVKIIFASGYFEPDIRTRLEKGGAKGFLQKPYVTEDILAKIRDVLDEK